MGYSLPCNDVWCVWAFEAERVVSFGQEGRRLTQNGALKKETAGKKYAGSRHFVKRACNDLSWL